MLEKKVFIQGMNGDVEDRLLQPGEYKYALNIRGGVSDNDNKGTIENTKGNEIVEFPIASGDNTCIGAVEDKLYRVVYYFLHNTTGKHAILEFKYDTNTIRTVLENSALNFSLDHLITGVNLIDGKLLKWTDDYNEPRGINVETDYTDLINQGLIEQVISAIKYMPANPPTVEYSSDDLYKSNHLRGSLWQFRTQYEYFDGEKSAWSPISRTALPKAGDQIINGNLDESKSDNRIKVSCSSGTALVSKINIAVRNGNNGVFQLAKTVERTPNIVEYYFYNNEVLTGLPVNTINGIDISESDKLYDAIPKKAKAQEVIDGNRLAYANILEGFDLETPDISLNPKYAPVGDSIIKSSGYLSRPIAQPGSHLDFKTTVNEYSFNLTDEYRDEYKAVFDDTSYYLWVSGQDNEVHGSKKIDRDGYPGVNGDDTDGDSSTIDSDNRAVHDLSNLRFELPNIIEEGDEISIEFTIVRKLDVTNWSSGTTPYGEEVNIPKTYTNSRRFNFLYIADSSDTNDSVLNDLSTRINTWAGSDPYIRTRVIGGNLVVMCAFRDERKVFSRTRRDISTQYNFVFISDAILFSHKKPGADKVVRCFKSGATHRVGVVYSDLAGRLSTVMGVEEVYVPTFAEVKSNGIAPGPASLQVFLNHTPPEWAHNYHLVYSKNRNIGRFLHFVIDEAIINPENSNTYTVSIKLISDYQEQYPNVITSYDWSSGDRIKFLKYPDEKFLALSAKGNVVDTEILGYSSADQDKLIIQGGLDGFIPEKGMVVELYSPLKDTDLDEQIYYEIGETHPIIRPGDISRLHGVRSTQYESEGVFNFAQTSSTPALISLYNEGDAYWRRRNLNLFSASNQYDTSDTYVEDQNISDFYESKDYNLGRPNVFQEDAQETRRPTTVYYSDPYIPDTNINGLSSFYLESFEEYDQNHGSIQRLYSEDKKLICFQELKVGQILVNEVVYRDLQGGSTVGASQQILSDMVYYAGEYGISKNPESFAVYGNRKYFADANRGAVLRLSTDGITPVSENGMHNYFMDRFSKGISKPMVGVYDKEFDEYVLSIPVDVRVEFDRVFVEEDGLTKLSSSTIPKGLSVGDEITITYTSYRNDNLSTKLLTSTSTLTIAYIDGDVIGFVTADMKLKTLKEYDWIVFEFGVAEIKDTLAFSEPLKKWTTFYGYKPDWMSEKGIGMISFNLGRLYIHNSPNVPYNNFYGKQGRSEIKVVSNENPSNIKFYKTIQQESTTPWAMPEGTNHFGQKTNLIVDDFDTIEGHHYAGFLKDENTPNIAIPLIEGDNMRSYSMSLLLVNDSTELEKLFSVGIKYEASELSNR
jgi:hypothetical protein